MPNSITITQESLQRSLKAAIDNAEQIITKSYLEKLELSTVYDVKGLLDWEQSIDPIECGCFYKVEKVVWNKEENFLDKLITIINVAYSNRNTVATVIDSDGQAVNYYIGILSNRPESINNPSRKEADKKAFYGALSGNMIGSKVTPISGEMLKAEVVDKIDGCKIASVSGIARLRNDELSSIDSYVQGIENMVDSLRGIKYTILMIADPLSSGEIQVIKQGYEMLHTQLSTFRNMTLTLNESEASSLSTARTESITEGISKGIALTQSKTDSHGGGSNLGVTAGISLGVPMVVGVNAGVNYGRNKSWNHADTTGQSESTTKTSQNSRADSETKGHSSEQGKSLQMNYENRSAKALLDKIDRHLERLDLCESFGGFNCAGYCISKTEADARIVASNYNALLRGEDSNIQASHINVYRNPDKTQVISEYLKRFLHPRFQRRTGADGQEDKLVVSPASVVSGSELALQIGFPKKSIDGLTVAQTASFGRNIPDVDRNNRLNIGNLHHMGADIKNIPVNLDIESLTMHTFITGSTGTGKTTLIYNILEELTGRCVQDQPDKKIKILVIEPAKGEYKNRFGNRNDMYVYGSNPQKTPLLRINPFSFPKEIHILEHIDRLIEIFNVCWPMYAAMPAVLKEAVECSYIVAGWDLNRSICKYGNTERERVFPSFEDVLKQVDQVMEGSDYSSESKGDYKGALCTRIKSMTNGINGQIFTADELSDQELFEENVIIDLSRIGSMETKALIMGLLVMKLQEYHIGNSKGENHSLRHVTVLEEAHNILRRTSQERSMEVGNLTGKSVELLANAIAEMRTYGEGFIIADQSPGLMDLSVIRNTNTKIILRLPDYSDRELVGRASGMSEEQIKELSKLPAFVSSIYQNNWIEPVLCHVSKNDGDVIESYDYHPESQRNTVDELLKYVRLLIMPFTELNRVDKSYVDKLKRELYQLNASAEAKIAFLNYLEAGDKESIQVYRRVALSGFFHAERAFAVSCCYERNYSLWYSNISQVLSPDISQFDELDQKRILANLAMENAEIKRNEDAVRIFEEITKQLT